MCCCPQSHRMLTEFSYTLRIRPFEALSSGRWSTQSTSSCPRISLSNSHLLGFIITLAPSIHTCRNSIPQRRPPPQHRGGNRSYLTGTGLAGGISQTMFPLTIIGGFLLRLGRGPTMTLQLPMSSIWLEGRGGTIGRWVISSAQATHVLVDGSLTSVCRYRSVLNSTIPF